MPVLTSYVSPRLRRKASQNLAHKRNIKIGYRGRISPYWLGELAQEKINIAKHAQNIAHKFNLSIDCSVLESKRFYGKQWDDFLMKSVATLCTVSGSSTIDFDGLIEKQVTDYLKEYPKATFEQAKTSTKLSEVDWHPSLEALSPKFFEAASFGTLIIHYPGNLSDQYSEIIAGGMNCFILDPLGNDDSNLAELLLNENKIEMITNNARNTILENERIQDSSLQELIYDSFIQNLDSSVSSSTTRLKVKQYKSNKTLHWERHPFPMTRKSISTKRFFYYVKLKLKQFLVKIIYSRYVVRILLPIWFKLSPKTRQVIQRFIKRIITTK
jgi:hypothetical protein